MSTHYKHLLLQWTLWRWFFFFHLFCSIPVLFLFVIFQIKRSIHCVLNKSSMTENEIATSVYNTMHCAIHTEQDLKILFRFNDQQLKMIMTGCSVCYIFFVFHSFMRGFNIWNRHSKHIYAYIQGNEKNYR